MNWRDLNWRKLFLAVVLCLVWVSAAMAQDETKLTKEEMKEFLLKAPVVKSKQSSKGITNPWHLTLSDGKITHDGSFQAIDEHQSRRQFDDGHVELNFV